jgi:hypothetical protein
MRRRDFLKTAGTAAVMPILGNTITPSEKVSSTSARLFVGCCAYSYRKHLSAGAMKMEDFFRKAVELETHPESPLGERALG